MKEFLKLTAAELRFAGFFTRLFASLVNEKMIRFASRLSRLNKGKARQKGLNIREVFIPREDNSLLRLIIFEPVDKAESNENNCAMLWLHGGGFAYGNAKSDMCYIKRIALSGCTVVSVDYTLSTVRAYPAALEDALLALVWLKESSEQYLGKINRIFVGGMSAGASLCASLCLYARDNNAPKISYQLLIAPMLDNTTSEALNKGSLSGIWDTREDEIEWRLYLRDINKEDEIPKYASCARETDYSFLPSTGLYVGSADCYYYETLRYADNLKKTGNDVHFKVFEGGFHGFEKIAPRAKLSQQAFEFIEEEISRVLSRAD